MWYNVVMLQLITTIDNVLHPIRTWDKWLAQKESDRRYLEEMTRKEDYISPDSCYLYYLYGVIKQDSDEDLWAKGVAAQKAGNPLMGFATEEAPPELILDPDSLVRENNTKAIVSGQEVNIKTLGIKFKDTLDEIKVCQKEWQESKIYEYVYLERILVSLKEKAVIVK